MANPFDEFDEAGEQAGPSAWPGMLEPGNIDLARRPVVRNPDGSVSTVRSISANFDGREYLLPTVSDDGRVLSDDEAIEQFRKSGKHLGAFDKPETATAFAQRLHDDQSRFYGAGAKQSAPAPNPFDEFDEEKREAAQEAQIRREMAMTSEEWRSYIRDERAKGNKDVVDYLPQPSRLQLGSDQFVDVIGVRDEMAGLGQFLRRFATSGGSIDEAGKAYSNAADRVRAERRLARKLNTVLPEVVGSLGSVGVRAVTGVPAVIRGFWPTAVQSAKSGAIGGAVTGVAQGEGGLVNRLTSGATGAGVGAALGPLISNVAVPAAARLYGAGKSALQYGNRAARSYLNPEQVAVENVADRMVASGLDPAAARGAVSPPPSPQLAGRNTPAGQPFNEADMADIISRQMAGESAASVGQSYGISDGTARRYLALYRDQNPTPMNIIDIAKDLQGEGASGPLWRLGRAAHGLAGDESADAAQALLSRQETQPGRVSGIARRAAGGQDYEATLLAGQQQLRQEANQAYRQFYAEPDLAINELADLMDDPLFREANVMAQRRARVETIRRNQDAVRAGRAPEPVPDVDAESQVFSPEMLDQIQRQLRITAEGAVSNPSAARHAQSLRDVFLDRIEQHYPTFRGIRQQYAQGMGEFGEEGALRAGRDLTNRLGERTDEALREFGAMTPAQQNLMRLGFARKIQDDAANVTAGNQVVNKYRNQATEDMVRRMWSGSRDLEAQGERLIRDLRREAITTKTKNDVLAGARTAEYEGDMGRLMEGAKAAADVATLNFSGIMRNLSTRLTTQLGHRGASATMRILTETDPARLLPLLNRLEQAAQGSASRRQLVHDVRALRAMSLPGTSAQVGVYSGGER